MQYSGQSWPPSDELGRIIPTKRILQDDAVAYAEQRKGIDSGTIQEWMLGAPIIIRVPVEKRERWRDIAYELAMRLDRLRRYAEADGKSPPLEAGWKNGVSVKLVFYVRIPSVYDAAMRQRAMAALGEPEEVASRDQDVLHKIAMGAACGHRMGHRRKVHIRYSAPGKANVREIKITYGFAEDDRESVWMGVRCIRNMLGGETAMDRAKDHVAQHKAAEHDAVMLRAAQDADDEARRKQDEKELLHEMNAQAHRERQEKKERARKQGKQAEAQPMEPGAGGAPQEEEEEDPYEEAWD